MADWVRKMIVTATASLCLSPGALVAAEDGDHRQAIINDWNAFIAFCTPFLEDPVKAKDALPIHDSGMTIAQTQDGMAYEYNHMPGQYELHTGAYLYRGNGETLFGCNTFRSLNAQFAQPVEMSQALEALLAQTGTITSSGGEVQYLRADGLQQAQLSDFQNKRYTYVLENVFPGDRTRVSVEVSYFSLSFHVDGAFEDVEGLQ
ncbi:MAG: hypothetical protein AB8B47_12130 [Roseobacter sp.]